VLSHHAINKQSELSATDFRDSYYTIFPAQIGWFGFCHVTFASQSRLGILGKLYHHANRNLWHYDLDVGCSSGFHDASGSDMNLFQSLFRAELLSH
jgi:hypothetical protein